MGLGSRAPGSGCSELGLLFFVAVATEFGFATAQEFFMEPSSLSRFGAFSVHEKHREDLGRRSLVLLG